MKEKIICGDAPKAIGPYNQAIETNSLIFVSGQIPFNKEGSLISNDIEKQTMQSLTNIENILKCKGLDKNSIVKTTIFLKDMNDFKIMNDIYSDFFKNTDFPARSTVEVSRLPKDVKIEIEAIAVKE